MDSYRGVINTYRKDIFHSLEFENFRMTADWSEFHSMKMQLSTPWIKCTFF